MSSYRALTPFPGGRQARLWGNVPIAPGMQNPLIVRKRIGDRIRFLRERKGWSQRQLALESGLGRRYVGTLERGEAAISIDSLRKLCDGFEMPMGDLVQGVDDLSPGKPKPRASKSRTAR
jgi:ribosome-binding protein aMBF1 (putative translation factor)